MKIVLYLDILLLVNFLTGYLLLCAAGRLAGGRGGGARLLAGAAVCAAASLLILLPPQPAPLQLLLKAVSGAAAVRAAFPWRGWRAFGRQGAWFFLLNLGGAGFCLLAALRLGVPGLRVNNLTVYLNLSPLLLLGCILGVYAGARLLLFLFGPTRPAEIWQLAFPVAGGRVELPVLHDTGFFLQDPYTGAPAVLVEYAACAARLPGELRYFLEGCFSRQAPPLPPPGLPVRLLECRTAAGTRVLPGLAVREACLRRKGAALVPRELTVVFTPERGMGGQFCGIFGTALLAERAAQKKGVDGAWVSVG